MEEMEHADPEGAEPPRRTLSVYSFGRSLQQFRVLTEHTAARRRQERAGLAPSPADTIDYDRFYNEVVALFGPDMNPQEVKAFFRKVSNNPEAPIDWSEIFGYYQSEESTLDSQMSDENTIFMISKREKIESATGGGKKQRDMIQSIIKLPQMDGVLTASLKGTLALYNGQMRQHACIHLRSNYVTIKPMEHCLLCVSAVSSSEQAIKDDVLIGDDGGFVNLFTVSSDELNIKHSKIKKTSQSEVLEAGKFKNVRRKLHNDWVVKVKFYPELDCFASCSLDSIHSLVLDHLKRIKDKLPVRELSVSHGVNTFAYSVQANIIATGGCDRIIRLWHPNIFTKPVGKLTGHLFSIADIAINEMDQHIISLSTARGFRVWDIQTLTLLQAFIDNGQGPGDRRIYSMVFDNKHLRLLTGSNTLDIWPLTRMIQDTKQVPHTHDQPINVLIYNRPLHQVLTICSESVVKVWEIETGYQIYEITEAHGQTIEVTAAAIHVKGFNLTTGAFNGSLKIWDFGSGQELKVFTPRKGSKDGEQWLCQLIYLKASDRLHAVLALEKSGKIKIFQGKDDERNMTVILELTDSTCQMPSRSFLQQSWMERSTSSVKRRGASADYLLPQLGVAEQESPLTGREVTCLDLLKVNGNSLLATGSINGLLVLWDFDSFTVQHTFKYPTSAMDLKKLRISVVMFLYPMSKKGNLLDARKESTTLSDRTVEDRKMKKADDKSGDHISEHKLKGGDEEEGDDGENKSPSAEISTLSTTNMCSPVLASAHEDGYLCLWNSEGRLLKKVLSSVKRPSTPLTALCTDINARVIVAGNKDGFIILWKVGLFLEVPQEQMKVIKQQICWQAHSLRIISLFYDEEKNVVVSASTDGSVRLWYALNGHYIGYFGQSRTFQLSDPREFILPCDVSELPLNAKDEKNVLGETKKYDYPLIYDHERWKTFTRQALLSANLKADQEVKYFTSLSSPKVRRRHLEGFTSLDRESGAVFGTIPIYMVPTIKLSDFQPPSITSYQESEHNLSTAKTKPRIIKKASRPLGGKNVKGVSHRHTAALPPINSHTRH